MVNQAKTIKFLAFAIILQISGQSELNAQKKDEIIRYQASSQELSTLMRGKLPALYNFQYNGNPYLSDGNFVQGELQYNNRTYCDILLNLDAASGDLLVKINDKVSPIATHREQTPWFKLGDRLFINTDYYDIKELPACYAEVLRNDSSPVLRVITKIIKNSSGNHNGPDIGYSDPAYNNDIPTYFEKSETYYTVDANSTAKKISRRKAAKLLKKPGSGNTFFNETDSKKGKNSSAVRLEWKKPSAGGIGLPENYFKEAAADSTDSAGEISHITASYRNKLYVIGSGNNEGEVLIEGTVRETESNLPLAGATVYDKITETYTRTGRSGKYKLKLPTGENVLYFSADGKEEIDLAVSIRGNGVLDVFLPEKIERLKAAVVSATSMENHRSAAIGIEEVNIKTMSKIPTALGEVDIVRSILTLPGVKTTGEASTGFNVRGGSQDQNLILFNGNTIYNPSHLFGIVAGFNPDVVDNVELYKSSIPAEYGGRISSVMTIHSRPGNMEKFKGSAGIGLLTSRICLEGPIVKGKTSFIMAGRTSYSDWLLKQLPSNSGYKDGKANFYDINLGLTNRFSESDLLSFNAVTGSDSFSFSRDTSFHYRNINASLQYRHRTADGNSLSLSAGYDFYENVTGLYHIPSAAFDLTTTISQAFLKGTREKVLGRHSITYGADVVCYFMNPGSISPAGEQSLILAKCLAGESGLDPSLFISDTWSVSDKVSLEGGLRGTGFLFVNDASFTAGPEVRLSARYSPVNNLSFKGGFNTMHQHIHLISNTSSISPMDTWKLTDKNISPTTGWQAAGGVYWTQMDTGLDFSAECYWKETQNGLDYKPGATLVMNERLWEDIVTVKGRSYGAEFMIKKSTGKLTGWLSYSYSRAQLRETQDRGRETIAGGAWYNAPYDKPHEVKLAANWAITRRYSISANLEYSTGRPVTVPSGRYFFGDAWRLAYTERNSYRIPDYFRIDLALNIDPGHYLKALVHNSITIGVYNVTGRKNPYSVFYKAESSGNIKGYMLSVFATQIPYINLNFLF